MKIDGELRPLDDSWDKFTENGLKLAASDISGKRIEFLHVAQFAEDGVLFQFNHPGFFAANAGFVLQGAGQNKITDVPDSAADAVEYALGTKDEIFLVPAICSDRMIIDGGGSLDVNYVYTFFSREDFLTPGQPLYGLGSNIQWQKFGGSNTGSVDYANARNRALSAKEKSYFRAFTLDDDGNQIQVDYVFRDGHYPPPPDIEETNGMIISKIIPQPTPPGFLLAIIRRGEKLLYVWS